jgi:cystathionine beta-lyase/cystathionine gamma-synthase
VDNTFATPLNQQYLDTLQIARDSGSQAASNSKATESS